MAQRVEKSAHSLGEARHRSPALAWADTASRVCPQLLSPFRHSTTACCFRVSPDPKEREHRELFPPSSSFASLSPGRSTLTLSARCINSAAARPLVIASRLSLAPAVLARPCHEFHHPPGPLPHSVFVPHRLPRPSRARSVSFASRQPSDAPRRPQYAPSPTSALDVV